MAEGQRCEFEHEAYGRYTAGNTWRGIDDRNQCWMTDTGNFCVEGGDRRYCLLHAPENPEPDDRKDWPLATREADQAALLKRLVEEWADEVTPLPKGERPALVLPGIRCGDVSLERQVFPADIDFAEAMFMGFAGFQEAQFTGKIMFGKATFESSAAFSQATFSSKAWFYGTTFTRMAYLREATFTSDAIFENTQFKSICHFTQAKFKDLSLFGSAIFSSRALFDDVTFERCPSFSGTKFFDGMFAGATFKGGARFGGATFSESAGFANTTFGHDTFFNRVAFDGDTHFHRATFHGAVHLAEARFAKHLPVHDARFLGKVILWDNVFEFPAYLNHCWINQLEYRAHSKARLFLNGCRVVDVRDGTAFDAETGRPLLTMLRDGQRAGRTSVGELRLLRQHCEHITFQNMDLSRADFRGADVSKARFISCRWNPPGKPRYPKLWGHPDRVSAKQDGINEHKLLLFKNAYEQLKNNLEGHRDYVQAGAFHYWEMALRQRLLRIRGLLHPGRLLEWLAFGFYGFTSDYGESYIKLGVATLFSVAAATALVGHFERVPLSWGGAIEAAEMAVFSLIPSGFQKGHAEWLGSASKWVVLAEGTILLVLATLFVMAVRRRFRR